MTEEKINVPSKMAKVSKKGEVKGNAKSKVKGDTNTKTNGGTR